MRISYSIVTILLLLYIVILFNNLVCFIRLILIGII